MNSANIQALSLSLVLYLILAIVFFGWGLITAYVLGMRTPDDRSNVSIIWMGWASSLLIFQILHLVFPITVAVVIPVFCIGFIFACSQIARGFVLVKCQFSLPKALVLVGVVVASLLVFFWITSVSMHHPKNYDSGLYHFGTIRWINSFSIVPGLGNLHGRFAFNQSFFTYVATLNFYPWFGHGRSLANSFLFFLTTATCLELLWPALKKPTLIFKHHAYKYLTVFFTVPLLVYLALFSKGFSAPTPDFSSTLLQIVIFLFFTDLIGDRVMQQGKQYSKITLLIVLAATAVTVKLSNLVFSAAIISFLFIFLWKRDGFSIKGGVRLLLPAFLIVFIWCLRGFILSGVPLYPSTILYIPTDWTVPENEVINQANYVYSWARQPRTHWSNVLGSWDWYEPWKLRILEKNIVDIVYPLIVSAVFCCINLFLLCSIKKIRFKLVELAILLPLILGIAFWFFTAPSPRFAGALFFMAPISCGVLLLVTLHSFTSKKVFFVVSFVIFTIINFRYFQHVVKERNKIQKISTIGWYSVKKVPLEKKVTESGLVVYIPKKDDRCWDAPIPCVPHFRKTLRLRVPGDIASGFSSTIPK